jgi:hypothetical protein
MKKKNLQISSVLIAVLTLSLILGGCSRINEADNSSEGELGITSPSSNNIVPPPFTPNPFQYPAAASVPPPGYQFVDLSRMTENPNPTISHNSWDWDNDFDICNPPDSIWAGKYVLYHQYKVIKLQKNELKLKSGCVPYSAWITMTKPVANEPWIEFEPHGMVFDQQNQVEVKLYYSNCILPCAPEDLTIWYWNEELQVYEYIGGENHVDQQRIDFKLNHFSRYVVAAAD